MVTIVDKHSEVISEELMTNENLQEIKNLVVNHKLSIFPVDAKTKKPITEHGFKDSTRDKDTILGWAKEYPDCGWAIPTGEINGLFVVDTDTRDGGIENWDKLVGWNEYSDSPVCTKTQNGGRHYWFRMPEADIRNSAGKIAEGIDIRGNGGYVVVPPTAGYEWIVSLESGLSEPPEWLLELILGEYKPPVVETGFHLPEKVNNGARNDTYYRMASSLQAKGLDDETILLAVKLENKKKGNPPLPDEEIEQLVKSALKHEKGEYARYELTDLGNAERFASQQYEIARYAPELKTWLIWNDKVWEMDKTNKVYELANDVVKSILKEAAMENDTARRKKLAEWALSSQSAHRFEAMLKHSKNVFGEMKIRPEYLDADPWFLNCQNGIVNLRTGELLPHEPDKFMSKITKGNFIPGKKHELWEKVLDDWTGGDGELKKFLQRMAGYTLIGENLDEKFFLILGETNTGKSTFTNSFAYALGDYAVTADAKTFLFSDGDRWSSGNSPRPDIVRLLGARLVVAGENDRGAKLNEAMVKNATGRDRILVRDLYSDPIEFLPAFKPWFFTNFAPKMSADDDAIWRRVVRVPFELTVPIDKRDPNIKTQLEQDEDCRDAILTWAIEGCLEYVKSGLEVPEIITQKTSELRDEMDSLGKFLNEMTVKHPKAREASGQLNDAYKEWCEENEETPVHAKEMKKLMEAKGYKHDRTGGRSYYSGLILRDNVPPGVNYEEEE